MSKNRLLTLQNVLRKCQGKPLNSSFLYPRTSIIVFGMQHVKIGFRIEAVKRMSPWTVETGPLGASAWLWEEDSAAFQFLQPEGAVRLAAGVKVQAELKGHTLRGSRRVQVKISVHTEHTKRWFLTLLKHKWSMGQNQLLTPRWEAGRPSRGPL